MQKFEAAALSRGEEVGHRRQGWARAHLMERGPAVKQRRIFACTLFLSWLSMPMPLAWAIANPASVFCVESGGKSEIRKGPNGDYGVCRLRDGRVVEEWTYYRQMKARTLRARYYRRPSSFFG
jgi:putative hemolysin